MTMLPQKTSFRRFMLRSITSLNLTSRCTTILLHPQWDSFGSNYALFEGAIYVDYDRNFCIIEFIGEWNDAINNDVMLMKREIIELMIDEGH